VKVREVALVELQKRITDGDSRLKQQQALYEAVRADRNMYSKSLIEAQVCRELGDSARGSLLYQLNHAVKCTVIPVASRLLLVCRHLP
jgi:hypothetical protein